MKKFKIRCSAIGKIMGGSIGLSGPQKKSLYEIRERQEINKPLTAKQNKDLPKLLEIEKNPQLPKGAKTYCQQWLKENVIYNRRKEISSKYTDKGNKVENDSIEFLNSMELEDFKKNEKFFENEYMQGTPDIDSTIMYDMKNSWDQDTFPLFETELPNKDYYYQGQGYMEICGREKFIVAYCLMDAPQEMIEDEARRASYKSSKTLDELRDEKFNLMTFEDVDPEYRINTFSFDKDESVITEIVNRVKLCRTYIVGLMKDLELRKKGL